MNLEALKSGFFSWLEEKIGKDEISKQEKLLDSDISIFLYGSEFKDYLVEQKGADVSIFSKSIGEIMSMDLVDGKLVDSNSDTFENGQNEAEENIEANGNINNPYTEILQEASSIEDGENNTASDEMENQIPENENGALDAAQIPETDENSQSTEGTESSGNIINRLLDKVYSNKTVIKTLDTDGDGVLSDEEKAKFEEFIKGYDGDETGDLSEADIKRAVDDIIDGKFSYDKDLAKEAEKIDEKTEKELKEKEEKADKTPTETNGANSAGGGGSVGGSGGSVSGSAGSPNSFSSSNSNEPKTIDNMSLEELEAEKTTRQTAVNDARTAVSDVLSGNNEAVQSAEKDKEQAEEDYKTAVKNDEKIDEDTKKKLNENLEKILKQEEVIDGIKSDINDTEAQISDQEAVVSAGESNLSALKSALSDLSAQTSDDPEKQAEISAKKLEVESQISQAEAQLEKDKSALQELKDKKTELETQLEDEEAVLKEYETEKQDIEKEILDNCSEDTKMAMEKFNQARDNVQTVKEQELTTAKAELDDAMSDLDEINAKINEKKAEQTKKENSVSDYDFDFNLTLSDVQKNELDAFKKNWDENKDKYKKVEEATGMPAELVAAIHWREGSGNFNTYLHNGQPLGQTTTIVPKGIYFEDWTEAAIDAVTNYGGGLSTIEEGNLDSYYDYAEKYNGLGYRNKGLPSPYVWAGTDKYSSGKYVADGVFDPNTVDQQLGVAVMLQALLE